MHPLRSANLSALSSPIAALCVRLESGELTWRQVHDSLVDLNVRRVSRYLDPIAREDLAAFLRALPLAEPSRQAALERF